MSVSDGDIISQVITYIGGVASEFQNKFTWEYQGTTLAAATLIGGLDTWAEDFYELCDGQMPSAITSFTSEYDVIAWDAPTEEWLVESNIGQGSGNVTFTNASDVLPWQCAPCLVGFTEKPKSRGRKFLPLFCEDQQDSSSWGAAAQTALGLALAEYVSSHTIITNHDVYPGVASTVWGIFLPFVTGLVKDIVFTQRRRTKGRGS